MEDNTGPHAQITTGSVSSDGVMNVPTAYMYVDAMNTADYLGINNWRLSTILNPDPSCNTTNYYGVSNGFGCDGGEMGHLFIELGGYDSTNGYGLVGSSRPELDLFSNYLYHTYITGTQWSRGDGYVTENFTYLLQIGEVGRAYSTESGYIMLVADGDVAAVPVPAAAWLLGSGLIGLIGVARRKTV